MMSYDPHAATRRRPAPTVPLEVAQALSDRADAAQREAEQLRAHIAELEDRPEPIEDDRVARLQADLANVRRHRDEAIGRARSEALGEGLLTLTDVIDDLQRALETAPDRQGPWHDGLRGVLDRVRGRLRHAGASELGEVGEPFDPAVHDAVGTADGTPGTVVAVAQTGLTLNDGTLLRPARVVVAR